jgi:hypothetical protein
MNGTDAHRATSGSIQRRHWRGETTDADRLALAKALREVQDGV